MVGGTRRGGGMLLWVACAVLSACGPSVRWAGAPPPQCEGVPSDRSIFSWAGLADSGGDAFIPDPMRHVEEDGLPVFHLFFSGALPDGNGYRSAWLVYRGRCYTMEAKYRGNTSSAFPKRSYTLKFPAHAPFEEPSLAGGFTGRRKVVLISPFNDNSYLRSRLAFTLWNRMAPEHIQVKTYSAVVYLNGRYWGLYTVADHVDRHMLAAHGLDPAGELFKAVELEANFSRRTATGAAKRHLHEGFEKKEGEPSDGPEAYESINALTAFVNDASAATFRAERNARLVPSDYEDWWIFSTLAFTSDAVSKNAYHYRASGPGTRWRFIPWDLDASFGQHWDTQRAGPLERTDFSEANHLFARTLAEPSFAGPMRERYRALLQGELRVEVVLDLIDTYAREVGPAARKDEAHWGAAHRSFPRWSSRTDFNTHEEEVAYIRDWVRARWDMLEQQLP